MLYAAFSFFFFLLFYFFIAIGAFGVWSMLVFSICTRMLKILGSGVTVAFVYHLFYVYGIMIALELEFCFSR